MIVATTENVAGHRTVRTLGQCFGVVVRSRLKVRVLEQWRVRWEFLQRLKVEFERQGIALPSPQLTVSGR